MDQHTFTSHGGEESDLGGPDDRAGTHRHIPRLHIVTSPADVGARAHAPQDLDSRLASIGPPQRKHGVGKGGHRRAGLDPDGLLGLQTGRCARARFNRTDHGQAQLAVGLLDARHREASTSTLRTA